MELLIYFLEFFICSLLVFTAGCFIWWLIVKLGKRELKRANEYDKLYAEIKDYLYLWPVTLINRDALLIMLNDLKKLKHKDREKTSVLANDFYWKYRGINKQRTKGSCEVTIGNRILKVEL